MAVTLSITPTRFIASAGKLDSQRRYIRKDATGPDLRFVNGQNMDVAGGGLRYVNPNGTNVDDGVYSGSFSGAAGVGVTIAAPTPASGTSGTMSPTTHPPTGFTTAGTFSARGTTNAPIVTLAAGGLTSALPHRVSPSIFVFMSPVSTHTTESSLPSTTRVALQTCIFTTSTPASLRTLKTLPMSPWTRTATPSL